MEEADSLAAELDAAAGGAITLRDKLSALAEFSAMGRGENWVQGKLRLTPVAQARAAAPLNSRPQLLGGETYEGHQAERIRTLMAALEAGDADARL